MTHRGSESPMDFEWQTHAPADATSPFHKLAMEHSRNAKKSTLDPDSVKGFADLDLGTHSTFDSPQKTSIPVEPKPKSQPFNFSNIPPSTPSQSSLFRAPSFTTPQKPLDVDFSSGGENISSPEQADTEDTPEASKTPTVYFTANQSKPAADRRNSLFNFYGRFAPPKPTSPRAVHNSNVLIRRVHKRRKREENLGRQLMINRRSSDDTSEDEPSLRNQRHPHSQMSKQGFMGNLFTFIESFPHAPSLLAKYMQLFFNSAIIVGILWVLYSFWKTIQDDVNRASEDLAAEALAEMSACTKNYIDNKCAGNVRLPALEAVCSNWELCMNRDPNAVRRAKLSARTFAEILNSFVEPISLKTMLFSVTAILLALGISNATFGYLRSSHGLHTQHHEYVPPRHPSASAPAYASNYDTFPVLQGQDSFGGQRHGQGQGQLAWGEGRRESPKKLEYDWGSAGKGRERARSRSPSKKATGW